ncbi:hypothetical protein OEZ85_011110 [Tetradesmus obliquus]|uniref:Uncharacterized protein n=1 Tax=Tetradesmus obliquus TaxID=3088 RepID=A0ABY8TPL9_TETOB|nr:hypothetical protein OEZ85_011110 [Tetradesmus obliquus]
MASVAEQQQLKKEQLLASLGQLLAGQSPDIQAAAILAVGNLNVLTCATLMEREEDVRRAAVMQLVQQATAASQTLGRDTFNTRIDSVEDRSQQVRREVQEMCKELQETKEDSTKQLEAAQQGDPFTNDPFSEVICAFQHTQAAPTNDLIAVPAGPGRSVAYTFGVSNAAKLQQGDIVKALFTNPKMVPLLLFRFSLTEPAALQEPPADEQAL